MSAQTIGAFLSGIIISGIFALLPRLFGALHKMLLDYVVIILFILFILCLIAVIIWMFMGMFKENKKQKRHDALIEAIARKMKIKLDDDNG
jgi:amino acid transporter